MIATLVRRLGRLAASPARAVARRLGPPKEPLAGIRHGAAFPEVSVRQVRITWEEAEQLLTAALLAGLIEQAEYQDSLALLARADDSRRPLQVPPL